MRLEHDRPDAWAADERDRAPAADERDRTPRVRRHVDVEATPDEVFEALVTEEGRERWLQEPERDIHVERADSPHRVSWWWFSDEQPATHVEFRIVALPRGARVIVTETAPRLRLAAMAAGLSLVAA